jgi:hypothetical protein
MYELKKIGKVFTSKFVGTGPSSYEKRIFRAAISQRLRNTAADLEQAGSTCSPQSRPAHPVAPEQHVASVDI